LLGRLSATVREAVGVERPRLRFLALVTTGHFVVHWYNQMLALSLPFLRADLGLSEVQVGSLTTVQMGVNSAANLPSGYLGDAFRRYGALVLASAILSFGLGVFLLGWSPAYGWALVGAGFVGLGIALWHPSAMGSLSLRFPERRGMALSVHGMGASLGDAVAPLVVGGLFSLLAWRGVLMGHLVPAGVIALLLVRALGGYYREYRIRPSLRAYAGDIGVLFRRAQVLAVLASGALNSMARLAILSFFPLYLRESLGYSAFLLGVYLTLLHVMGLVSQPVMGPLSDRVGRKAVLVPAFLTMSLLYLLVLVTRSGVALGVVVGALGLFFYAILNVVQSALMDVAPEGVQASTMGVLQLVAQPFALFSPILAGWLIGRWGLPVVFVYAASATLLAGLVLVPVRFRRPGG